MGGRAAAQGQTARLPLQPGNRVKAVHQVAAVPLADVRSSAFSLGSQLSPTATFRTQKSLACTATGHLEAAALVVRP